MVQGERVIDGVTSDSVARKGTSLTLYEAGKQTQSSKVNRAINLDDLADLDDIMTQKDEK